MPYHTCTYNRLPEDEHSGSKHVQDSKLKIKKKNILEHLHFVGLYCATVLQKALKIRYV
jgi:hypothetical protein